MALDLQTEIHVTVAAVMPHSFKVAFVKHTYSKTYVRTALAVAWCCIAL